MSQNCICHGLLHHFLIEIGIFMPLLNFLVVKKTIVGRLKAES